MNERATLTERGEHLDQLALAPEDKGSGWAPIIMIHFRPLELSGEEINQECFEGFPSRLERSGDQG